VRFLVRRGVEVHVMQPSSLPVDRRARRAKTDIIDVEMLLRTLMAWLRGEPRVCSMVPIPSEADEEARRAYREREDLTCERRSIANKIDGILATLGVKGFKALRRDRREQLTSLRQPDGDPGPRMARARIERLLDRLELVLKLIEQVEAARDAVLKKAAPADEAEQMIRSLTDLRSIGPDFATLLVREAFVREFRDRRALGGYVGLGGTPFSSGGSAREQGIGKDGNRRLRAGMVELAWMWLRWQPGSALSIWFRARGEQVGGRMWGKGALCLRSPGAIPARRCARHRSMITGRRASRRPSTPCRRSAARRNPCHRLLPRWHLANRRRRRCRADVDSIRNMPLSRQTIVRSSA